MTELCFSDTHNILLLGIAAAGRIQDQLQLVLQCLLLIRRVTVPDDITLMSKEIAQQLHLLLDRYVGVAWRFQRFIE